MEKFKINNEIKLKLENWDIQDVFSYLYHLRANPSKRNNQLEKIVKKYINNY